MVYFWYTGVLLVTLQSLSSKMELTGKHIISIRKQALKTQQEFAKDLGVTKGSVIKWEKGRSTPSKVKMEELKKLAVAQAGSDLHAHVFHVPTIIMDENLSAEDREFESELITYFRLLDRETRLKHLKAVTRDASLGKGSRLQKTLNRK